MSFATEFAKFLTSRQVKERQNRKEFTGLIASPVTGNFAMPANARILVASIAGASYGTLAVEITGPSAIAIKSKALVAGEKMFIGYIARASVISAKSGFEIYVDLGLGKYLKIATGV